MPGHDFCFLDCTKDHARIFLGAKLFFQIPVNALVLLVELKLQQQLLKLCRLSDRCCCKTICWILHERLSIYFLRNLNKETLSEKRVVFFCWGKLKVWEIYTKLNAEATSRELWVSLNKRKRSIIGRSKVETRPLEVDFFTFKVSEFFENCEKYVLKSQILTDCTANRLRICVFYHK